MDNDLPSVNRPEGFDDGEGTGLVESWPIDRQSKPPARREIDGQDLEMLSLIHPSYIYTWIFLVGMAVGERTGSLQCPHLDERMSSSPGMLSSHVTLLTRLLTKVIPNRLAAQTGKRDHRNGPAACYWLPRLLTCKRFLREHERDYLVLLLVGWRFVALNRALAENSR